jgi:glycosyltransferase involved in cell wall biosynthesis
MKIRMYGHGGVAKTGYAQANLDLAMALARTPGVTLELRPLGPPASIEFSPAYLPLASCVRRDHELDPAPDVVIVHTLPLDCARVLEVAKIAPGPKLIAYTTWETFAAPRAVCEALTPFDQVWTPSAASSVAFDAKDEVLCGRVRVLPHCFDEETLPARRAEMRMDGPFRFYWIGAWTARKNPTGLIRAFAHAFTPADDVQLVLHSPGLRPEALATALASTGLPEAEMPKIDVSPTYRPDDWMMKMHGGGDCFVTVSHGEAWNLPAFEAMLANRMVLAPEGQGSDDFLVDTSAQLVNGDGYSPAMLDVRVKAVDGSRYAIEATAAQGLTAKCLWQEPDLFAFATIMQGVARDKRRDLHLEYDPCERYGYAAVGRLALSLITEAKVG